MKKLILPTCSETMMESQTAHPSAEPAKPHHHPVARRLRRKVITSRVLFVVGLMVVAALLGYAANHFLEEKERILASEQFEAFTYSALDSAQKIAKRQHRGLLTLASVIEQGFPDASDWPFVYLHGFEAISNHIIQTTSAGIHHVHMGFLPIVYPNQTAAFEEFAMANFEADKGVFHDHDGLYSLNASFQEYSDTEGLTYWGSPYQILTPFLQHSHTDDLFLMNWHSVEKRGRLVDMLLKCSERRAQEMSDNANNQDFIPRDCGATTDIIDLYFREPVEMPSAVKVAPIYPANNPTQMAGLLTSTVVWEETLFNVFSKEVSGVDCVLQTDTMTFTYAIHRGEVSLKGAGDLHDSTFDDYAQEVVLSTHGCDESISPAYTLTAYPNGALFEVYETDNPMVATIGAVCIILFTSVLFFLYDFFVRTEFRHKDSMSDARRKFVRFISHEVRTPLNAVCMGLQLVQDEMTNHNNTRDRPLSKTTTVEKELARRYAEISGLHQDIFASANGAVGVLNDLLNYDKVESGTLQLELEVIPVFDLIQRIVAEFRQPAKLKKIDCKIDFQRIRMESVKNKMGKMEQHPCPQETVDALKASNDIKTRRIIGDESRLAQVLRNVISNALKFTPPGGKLCIRPVFLDQPSSSFKDGAVETSEVTLHSGKTCHYTHAGTLRIEVEDSGTGMTQDQLKDLFKEGVQFDVNKLQQGQGSGLGLYIAKGMLEQHGGSLTATSDGKGCGTTFAIGLPLYHVEGDAHVLEGEPSERTLDWDKLKPMNILVVDDAKMNRKLLCRLLRNHGHVCIEAENGKVAVEKAMDMMKRGNGFDSILMDNEMPEMDGCQAATTLRAGGCDSFIVGITGTLFSEDIERFRSSGANAVLPKPVNLHDLMDLLVESGVADMETSDGAFQVPTSDAAWAA